MNTTMRFTTILTERINALIDSILTKQKVGINYNEDLRALLEMFLSEDFDWSQITIMEFMDLEFSILHHILNKATETEAYEVCAKILKLINLEYELFQELVNSLEEDDERKDDYQEQLNYNKQFYNKE